MSDQQEVNQKGLEDVNAGRDVSVKGGIDQSVNKTIINHHYGVGALVLTGVCSVIFIGIWILSHFFASKQQPENYSIAKTSTKLIPPTESTSTNQLTFSIEDLGIQNTNQDYKRGIDRMKKQNYAGAIADFNLVISRKPNDINAYLDRGLARRALGEHQGAIDDFTKVLSLDEHNFYAYNNRCAEKRLLEQKKNSVYENNPNLEDAMKDCDRAIAESHQKYASPFFNRAVINAMQGKLKVAIEDFEESARIALREGNDAELYHSSRKEIEKILNLKKSSTPDPYDPQPVHSYDPPAPDNPPPVDTLLWGASYYFSTK
jgi:tetratricopeptide (TPR) repeat protein